MIDVRNWIIGLLGMALLVAAVLFHRYDRQAQADAAAKDAMIVEQQQAIKIHLATIRIYEERWAVGCQGGDQ